MEDLSSLFSLNTDKLTSILTTILTRVDTLESENNILKSTVLNISNYIYYKNNINLDDIKEESIITSFYILYFRYYKRLRYYI